jgi:hypothetical protein
LAARSISARIATLVPRAPSRSPPDLCVLRSATVVAWDSQASTVARAVVMRPAARRASGSSWRRAAIRTSRAESAAASTIPAQVAAVRIASRENQGSRPSSPGSPRIAVTGASWKTTRWLSEARRPAARYQPRSTSTASPQSSRTSAGAVPSSRPTITIAASTPPAPEQKVLAPRRTRPASVSCRRAGSPSSARGSAPQTPSSRPSSSTAVSSRSRSSGPAATSSRSTAFRWPSRMRATEASAAATRRSSAHSEATEEPSRAAPIVAASAPAAASASKASRGKRGTRSSSGAAAAIEASAWSGPGVRIASWVALMRAPLRTPRPSRAGGRRARRSPAAAR